MVVCRHNFTRSRFGAEFLRGYLNAKKIKADVISRGVGWSSNFIGKRIKKEDLKGMTRIFVMEDYMKDWIVDTFGFDAKKIIVFNIPDDYGFWKKLKVRELDKLFQKIDWKKYL
jgi:predicted protein tyrosine phosphatase